MVEDLIPQMKNMNIESGQSAFDIACQKGHEQIVLLLIKNYKDLNINLIEKANEVFYLACEQGYVQIIDELIERNYKVDNAQVALNIACQNGHDKVVWMLMSHSKDLNINLRFKNNEGETPFHISCKYGHENVVKSLMSHFKTENYPIDLKDNYGKTAIDLAIENHHSKALETIFKIACEDDHEVIVETLISRSSQLDINYDANDKNKETPFLTACKKGKWISLFDKFHLVKSIQVLMLG